MKQMHWTKVALITLSLALSLGLAVCGAKALAAKALTPLEALDWTPPSPAYKVFVNADGLYQMTYADLQAAGLPVDSINPHTFRLFWMEQEVAIQEVGDGDSSFEPGEAVLFYGRSIDSLFYEGLLPTNKYTGTNVYWLTYGGANGLRMATKDGSLSGSAAGPFLHKEHLEQNFAYDSARPFEHNADHWFWNKVQASGAGSVGSRSYSFTTQNIASGPSTGTLTVNLVGYMDVAHHLRLYMNNNLLLDDSSSWNYRQIFSTTVNVPQAYLVEGSNTIKVELVNDLGQSLDSGYTNWLEVAYYDTYVAEGDRLAFNNAIAGSWRYTVTNFITSTIDVYDVSNLTAVQRFVNTTVTGSGPYTVSFGDAVGTGLRYLAVTPTARLTPSGIVPVTHRTSGYTPVDLLATNNKADYILITHGDFWTQAQTLAAYRIKEYSVVLVDVQEIYDQFNGGLMSAEAVHDFLAYAYSHWQPPAPAFVLLLGDGTSDMRNYFGSSAPTYIPPYLYLADQTLGETATENRFVTLVGGDVLPEMHIGRLPANTPAEAEAMIAKTINYGAACCNPLTRNVLFVTDNEDIGGDFYDYSNALADGWADPPTNTIKAIPPWLPEPYTATKAYLGLTCDPSVPSPAAGCRYQITTTLNITGAVLVNYIGHATKTTWGSINERLMDWSAWSTLTNTNVCQLPIILAMTCYEGSFHEPQAGSKSLGESSVLMPNAGAVASWSPTGFGLLTGHHYLDEGFFLALFHDKVQRLGAAITQAKKYLLDHAPPGKYDDLLDTFVLLGDPALTIKLESNDCTPTAVCMDSFHALAQGQGVLLAWQTASEVDMLGFNVLRSENPHGTFVAINEEFIFAELAGGAGSAAYTYVDKHVLAGKTYYYTLEIVHLDGQVERYGLVQATVAR